jgi:hypothetical protein
MITPAVRRHSTNVLGLTAIDPLTGCFWSSAQIL